LVGLLRRSEAASVLRHNAHQLRVLEGTFDDLSEEVQGAYTGINEYYRDKKSGIQKSITAIDLSKPRRLRYLYATKAAAKRAVDREYGKMASISVN
jgi:hypothetical protein